MKLYYWILASRPKTLFASIIPVLCSILILPNKHQVNFTILLVTIIAAVSIQVGTNFINDLYDYIKGADNSSRLGPPRMVQSGLLSKQEMYKGIFFIFFIALLCGFYLVFLSGNIIKWPIMIIGCSSFLFAFLYTGGPKPIGYIGLGEFFVFIYFGLLAVIGSYYLQSGILFNYKAVLLGATMGCLNMILLIINNIRDFPTDIKSNKKTLVVMFGENFGKIEIAISILLVYQLTYILSSMINLKIFWIILYGSLPIVLGIIYDIIFLKGEALNHTLSKASSLLIAYIILLYLGLIAI